MPRRVYNNVEDHRVVVNGIVVEDVTSVEIPTWEHPTNTYENVAGVPMNLEIPNTTRVNAMELTVNHNMGVNGERLRDPGKLTIEVRVARQYLATMEADVKHGGMKYRMTCMHKSTAPGTVEAGNPMGYAETYSVLSYEELVDGQQVALVDAAGGTIRKNGRQISDDVEALLR